MKRLIFTILFILIPYSVVFGQTWSEEHDTLNVVRLNTTSIDAAHAFLDSVASDSVTVVLLKARKARIDTASIDSLTVRLAKIKTGKLDSTNTRTVTVIDTGGLHDYSWDDIRVASLILRPTGSRQPDIAPVYASGDTSVYAYSFSATAQEELFFSVQIPHSWAEGTAIEPHVHWGPSGTGSGNVVWGIDYSIATINDTLSIPVRLTVTAPASGRARDHLYADMAPISMTGKKISSMVMSKVFRLGADGADTYAADAFIWELDFHFKQYGSGSRTELTK